ncbi:hypothetical protein BGZ73_005606 [Actinomortierella ambigua]|nr:hypothetical protein BGZ73_005606 [Actinomortierella ambigua]
MSSNGFVPVIAMACASAVLVASVSFICHMRRKRRLRRQARAGSGQVPVSTAPNTVELDYPDHDVNRDSSALLVAIPFNNLGPRLYRDPLVSVEAGHRSLRAPPRRAHPGDIALMRESRAAAATTTMTAATVTNPYPARSQSPLPPPARGSGDDPTLLPPPGAKLPLRLSPSQLLYQLQLLPLPDHPGGKEEYMIRTVQEVSGVRVPETAVLAAPAPAPVPPLSSVVVGTAFVVDAENENEEDDNNIRTQPLDQLPRPIGSFRSPRMPAAMPDPTVIGSQHHHHHHDHRDYQDNYDRHPLYRPPSPGVTVQQQREQHLTPRFSPNTLPAAIVTSQSPGPSSAAMQRPNNRVHNNNNNMNNMNNNNAGQQNDQATGPRRGRLERSATGTTMNTASPLTPSFSPDSPLSHPLPSPSNNVPTPPIPSPLPAPISPMGTITPPVRRKQSQTRNNIATPALMTAAFGPTTAAAEADDRTTPGHTAMTAITPSSVTPTAAAAAVLKDEYRSSTSTYSSSQDDATTLNDSECSSVTSPTVRKRGPLAPQNASGKGTRFSTFNYVP